MTGRTKLAIGIYSAVAALLAAAGYLVVAGDDEAPAPATTTTIGVGPPWPLTGVASAPGDPLQRPAVAVKVSAGDGARPQTGILEADQVWEEQVEGISRFIAIYQSTDAAPVGPIRSARDSDVDLLQAFGTPVFVWGGANEGVAARVEASPLVSFNVDPDSAPNSYRDPERTAPDNLFIDGTGPYFDAVGASAPVAQFSYRADGAEAGGASTLGAEIDWGGSQVAYLWDDTRGGWARFQDGSPHVDADDQLVAPANVVVLLTEYGAAPSDPRSPVAVTVGEGEATIFTAGQQIAARWSRSGPTAPYVVTDNATGAPVELTPGTTWVALAEPGRTAFLDEAGAEQLRAQSAELG